MRWRPSRPSPCPCPTSPPWCRYGGRPGSCTSIAPCTRRTRSHGTHPANAIVALDSLPSVRDWAVSGAMALTGRRDGPPLMSSGMPATATRAAVAVFEALRNQQGPVRPPLPGACLGCGRFVDLYYLVICHECVRHPRGGRIRSAARSPPATRAHPPRGSGHRPSTSAIPSTTPPRTSTEGKWSHGHWSRAAAWHAATSTTATAPSWPAPCRKAYCDCGNSHSGAARGGNSANPDFRLRFQVQSPGAPSPLSDLGDWHTTTDHTAQATVRETERSSP